MRTDYIGVDFRNDGKLKLLIIVGTRPEIIRLAAVIDKCRKYFDCLLAHTGQNYDYNLNGIFFRDLRLRLQSERDILQGFEVGGSGRLFGRRGGRSGCDDGEYYQRLL